MTKHYIASIQFLFFNLENIKIKNKDTCIKQIAYYEEAEWKNKVTENVSPHLQSPPSQLVVVSSCVKWF